MKRASFYLVSVLMSGCAIITNPIVGSNNKASLNANADVSLGSHNSVGSNNQATSQASVGSGNSTNTSASNSTNVAPNINSGNSVAIAGQNNATASPSPRPTLVPLPTASPTAAPVATPTPSPATTQAPVQTPTVTPVKTELSGIIGTNRTLTLDQSPYSIKGKLQIAEGATLTIAPGVIVEAAGPGSQIELFGSLSAVGTPSAIIEINDISITTQRVVDIHIEYARFQQKRQSNYVSLSTNYNTAAFKLRNSLVKNGQMNVPASNGDIDISGNYFDYADLLLRGISSRFFKTTIKSNTFVGARDALSVREHADRPLSISQNNFLNTTANAVSLQYNTYGSGSVDAKDNYWNTSDATAVGARILDRNDDLNITRTVEFAPILPAKSTTAPTNPW